MTVCLRDKVNNETLLAWLMILGRQEVFHSTSGNFTRLRLVWLFGGIDRARFLSLLVVLTNFFWAT